MNSSGSSKFIDWGVRLITPLIVLSMSYVVATLSSLEKRATIIEQTYYTQREAAQDQKDYDKTIQDIRLLIFELDKKLSLITHLTQQVEHLTIEIREMNTRAKEN